MWKVGDTFEYPSKIGTPNIYKLVGSVSPGVWDADLWDPQARSWGTRRRWYTPDTNMIPCPDPYTIVAQATAAVNAAAPAGGTAVVAHLGAPGFSWWSKKPSNPQPAPQETAALLKFFAGDVAKKPKGMPDKCFGCTREMSATMDRYYGDPNKLVMYHETRNGAEISRLGCSTKAANLCSNCRPRGC